MTICAFALLDAGQAAAQETGWTFEGTPYARDPSLSATVGTPFGDVEPESDGRSALSALDMAFMGTLEAGTGKWGFIGDLLQVDLSSDTDAPFGKRFEGSTLDISTTAPAARAGQWGAVGQQPGRRRSMRRISGVNHDRGAISAFALALAMLGPDGGPAWAGEAQAREILTAMTEYLAAEPALSFDVDSTIEVVTTDGAKVAIASSASLAMERPDRIRVRRHGGFATVEMTFDGTLLSVANSDAKVYGQSEVPGTVDDLIDTLREV